MHARSAILFLLFAALSPCAAFTQVPVTQLTGLSRQAGQIGTTFECQTEAGQHLGDVDQLVFSHPLIQATVLHADPMPFNSQPPVRYGYFSVSIDPNVPAGLYEARAVGAFGVSNPLPFYVTAAEVTAVGNEHIGADKPAALVAGQWIQARCPSEQTHYYTIEVQQGQHVQIRSLAQRIDSRALLQLRLIDPQGQCVVDHLAVDRQDPRIDHQAETNGTYILQVRDFLFRGGNPFTYLLSASLHAEPPVAETSLIEQMKASVGLANPATPVPAEIPPLDAVDAVSLPEPLAAATLLTHDETTFADDQAQPIQVPCLVTGEFLVDRVDDDSFQFHATQGTTLTIEVLSQRLAQATDPALFVYSIPPAPAEAAEGAAPAPTLLGQNDDLPAVGTDAVRAAGRDAVWTFTAPHEGEFLVTVRDQFNRRTAETPRQYLLSIAPAKPDFKLFAYVPHGLNVDAQSQPTGIQLHRRSTTAIEVFVVRQQGYGGPIDITTKPLPPGVTCKPLRIAAGQNRATLILAADAMAPSTLSSLEILGTATDLPAPNVHRALATSVSLGPDGQRNVVDSRLTTSIVLSVSAERTTPLEVTVGTPAEPLRMARGGKLALPLQLERTANSVQPCIFRGRDLPPNTTLADVTVNPDQSAGQAELNIAANAAPGVYDFWLQMETTLKWQGNQQRHVDALAYLQRLTQLQALGAAPEGLEAAIKSATERATQIETETKPFDRKVFLPVAALRVEIVESPFQPTVPATLSGTAATVVDATVTIEKQFGFDAPVTVQLIEPPAGITAEPASIAAGQTETVLKLNLPAELPAGEHPLKLQFQYEYGGTQTLQRVVPLTIAP